MFRGVLHTTFNRLFHRWHSLFNCAFRRNLLLAGPLRRVEGPSTCVYLKVFRRISLPHWGQAVIQTAACQHVGKYSLPSGVSAGVPAGLFLQVFLRAISIYVYFSVGHHAKSLRLSCSKRILSEYQLFVSPHWMEEQDLHIGS